jgi:predicted polyphosphate/ATP-dependent NAD kinase
MTAQPTSVGIIANPASGSDIRRLVALGTVFGTQEKINIVQRILVGLDAAGVDRFYLMPDHYGIGRTALGRLPKGVADLRQRAQVLDMRVSNGPEDSVRAAQQMRELGVGCIVVLGGDGTNRVVAKGCGDVPLVPVSTGTNNVIPYMVEGTVAGLAAGFVARHSQIRHNVAYRSKWLQIAREGHKPDVALVDVAVLRGSVVGTRAIWEPNSVLQVILTRAEPTVTGISSLGGLSKPVSPTEPKGLSLWLGEPKVGRVTAPLAPGLVKTFGIKAIQEMAIADSVTVSGGNRLLALDGEREIALYQDARAQITLRDDGPWLVDVHRALQMATGQGVFVDWA